MKLAALLAATAAMALASPAAAQMRALNDPVTPHPDPESLFTSDDPQENRNAQAALHIMRELLQCNQWDRAGEWLTDRYIQHNPMAASGLEGVVTYFTEVAQVERVDDCGELTSPIVEVVAEDDMVVVLIQREVPYADNPDETYTTTWFDAWRFVDGKADVHWDPATLPTRPAPAPAASAPQDEQAARAEIESLMWRYVRAADTLDADAYASVFTPDGSFNSTQGHEALRAMIEGMAEGQEQRRAEGTLNGKMYHVMANQTIEFVNPDHARVHYYWQTMFAGNDLANPPRIAAGGRGVDDVVRVDGEWLIQSRNVVPTEG
ncbi:nuclear transport factor 2 family protein [Aurantiacibacter poecillastricola]|uniref:nuclear transport factor 2 family protein n=1 Tax=Aurantiacibacter poecillastricola TaxID=3064385 RepID=UPI00273E4656|nr:nuclear transport factor 2 family protein [Aurantiacibacter sp. 219JJ12-13]MDP5261530.1 nuclear transport factor 2 family protein [Aurantiacibacter sp. 219JJ12-13]